jgi:putative GTP pyrophosphokinase
MAEDLWAEIEHILGYKPHKRTSATVRQMFRIMSDQLASLDDHFSLIFDELRRHQSSVSVDADHPLNAENLGTVLAEANLSCSQGEVDGLLKLLYSRGVRTIAEWRLVASPNRVQLVGSVYQAEKGRLATNFEVVAALATLSAAASETDDAALIRAHMAYLDAWDSLPKP